MKGSNCSSSNNSKKNNSNKEQVNLIKFRNNMIKANLNKKVNNNHNENESKITKLSQNTINNNNIKIIDEISTIIPINSNSLPNNEINNIKDQIKKNTKKTIYNQQNSRMRSKLKLNYISSDSTTMYNSTLKNKDIIKKINNISLRKYNNNKLYLNYTKTISNNNRNKSPQYGKKYLNEIMKKINLSIYKTSPITSYQSRKKSNNKKNIKNKFIPLKSNLKSKSTSITKINNLIVPTMMNNYKKILSKYSAISQLTSHTINNISNNDKNEKKKINLSSISKYNYRKNNTQQTRNKKNKKENELILNIQSSLKSRKFNKYYGNNKINLNFANNIFQITLTSNSIKNSSKSKNELETKNKKINNLNNIFNYQIHFQKKGLTGNNNSKIKNIKKYNSNHTKSERQIFSVKNKRPITTTSSFLNNIYKINKKEEIEKEKREFSSSSISLSSFKDENHYKSECKKLSEKIKKYYIENNNEYPKTNINFYKIGRCIGKGAFGKVNISLHTLTGKIVAIKSINKSKRNYSRKNILYEIKLMKKLRGNKNIVRILEKFEDKKYIYIVMENIIGGNLLNAIKKMSKFPENLSKYIFKQIIETLKYIHSKNIVHRDIKPHNILLTLNNEIKICDFGVGKEIIKGKLVNETCGTPAYLAPELLKGNYFDPYKSDIWSCGIVLYFMLSGFVPFKGDNDYELHQNILLGKFNFIDGISNECFDLIKKILEINPEKRYSLDDIIKHSWFKDSFKKMEFNLFTKAEKVIFGKLNIDYKNAEKNDLIENFTYKNLESDFDNQNKNIESFSFILAPNNSKINYYFNDGEEVYFSDLMIKDNIMKFNFKVWEYNLNYEVKYNADIDQGFLRKEVKKNKLMISLNNSINENKYNNHSIDNIVYSSSKKENEIDDNKNNKISNDLIQDKNSFTINEKVLDYVEEFGYKRDYIINSLLNDELNYCTATYYIKLFLMNE